MGGGKMRKIATIIEVFNAGRKEEFKVHCSRGPINAIAFDRNFLITIPVTGSQLLSTLPVQA